METEREYRIRCIKKLFSILHKRKIAIYGTGINAGICMEYAGDLEIIGLIDEAKTGQAAYGLKVLSEEELIALQVDTIIIAAQIDSAIAVYKRIRDFCREHDIEIFDLYGNNVSALLHSIIQLDAGMDSRQKMPLQGEQVKAAIHAADVVSIDLDALFNFSQKEPELLRRVWQSRFETGAKAFVSLRRKIGEQQENSYGNLNTIYGVLKAYLCISDEDTDALLKTELQMRRHEVSLNPCAAKLINEALEDDRKLFFINESILPGTFWTGVLADHGFGADSFTLLNRSESAHNKYNGLYRELFEYEPEKKYLHIGNDVEADGIAASVYGLQSVVIKETDKPVSEKEHCTGLPISQIRDYCTGKIKMQFSECRFAGYTKLDVAGRYSIFVNNRAEIKPGWLEQLFSTAENHAEAMMICSRVSRDDGTILYAGETVSEDEKAQRTRMVSGYLPLYDYVREAGQSCLMSFLVRKTEWDRIEPDAADIRDAVNKVMEAADARTILYQPLSEVICAGCGEKTELSLIDGSAVSRPKILVTDNLLTRFDHDAGARCTWLYLKQFHKLGFDVTLMAQNFNEIQPYVMLIQQAGIRVIYGEYYRVHWKKWLAEEGGSFSYVYTQRPESTSYFLEEIRKNCRNAKVIYFAHDLHFLRLQREYEITGNPVHLRESEKNRKLECALIENADVVHVVGAFEQQYLQKMYPEKMIRNIPLYIYEQNRDLRTGGYDINARQDLLYVGSFGHPPNLDAVIWFAEQIFPAIVRRYPDIVWHIVGANPPVEVQKYQGKNLMLHGFLSDEELMKLYRTCRMVVVPLRYGAGVKGKIVEASYYQVPIVTTPIGAEGIPQEEHNMMVCETAGAFSEAVCELYSDEARLQAMSAGGRRLIEKYYSEAAVNDVLSLDMKELH